MKGVIFNLFEDFVVENFGAETYESVLENAALGQGDLYVGPGSYPDEDLLALIDHTVKQTGASMPEAIRAFGASMLPKLIESHPKLRVRTREMSAKDFLLCIDAVIHVEVAKLLPGAKPPRLICTETGQATLDLLYRSERRLCLLIEGFLDGVEKYFNQSLEYSHSPCGAARGEDCLFSIRFIGDA